MKLLYAAVVHNHIIVTYEKEDGARTFSLLDEGAEKLKSSDNYAELLEMAKQAHAIDLAAMVSDLVKG